MKKILIIGNNDVGLYNFRKELIEGLISSEMEVHFTVPYGNKVPLIEALGGIYYHIEVNRRGTNFLEEFKLYLKYVGLIKKVKPDLILTYTIKPNIYGGLAASKCGVPYISTITGLGTAFQATGLKMKGIKILYKRGMKNADYVFFQNEYNKELFIKNGLINENRIRLVSGSGVNTEHYSPAFQNGEGIEKKDIIFLFIARIMKEKGIEEYLEAAEAIKAEFPQSRFQILGGYDEENYKQRIELLATSNVVEYLGISADTRLEISKADCIVLPSYHEGMSNVLLEGASMGKPLIASDINGCKEIIDAGTTGYLCEPRSAESLLKAFKSFLMLSRQERYDMGVRAREKIMREFNRDDVIKQYLAVIKESLSARNS